MTQIRKLLQMQVMWLSHFYKISKKYLSLLEDNADAAIADADCFENNRQSLLNILGSTEKQIEDLSLKVEPTKVSNSDKMMIQKFVSEVNSEMAKIVEQDERILKAMSQLKDESQQLLKQVTKGSAVISKYRQKTNSSNIEIKL